MLILAVLVALTPADLTGFWHSEQDMDGGFGSCYFFWESGEYAHLRSVNEGILYLGDWYMTSDELVLNRWDAMGLDGAPINMGIREITLTLTVPAGKAGRIFLDGDSFYLLDSDPDRAILSLVPTWRMSSDESEAFSTYD